MVLARGYGRPTLRSEEGLIPQKLPRRRGRDAGAHGVQKFTFPDGGRHLQLRAAGTGVHRPEARSSAPRGTSLGPLTARPGQRAGSQRAAPLTVTHCAGPAQGERGAPPSLPGGQPEGAALGPAPLPSLPLPCPARGCNPRPQRPAWPRRPNHQHPPGLNDPGPGRPRPGPPPATPRPPVTQTDRPRSGVPDRPFPRRTTPAPADDDPDPTPAPTPARHRLTRARRPGSRRPRRATRRSHSRPRGVAGADDAHPTLRPAAEIPREV